MSAPKAAFTKEFTNDEAKFCLAESKATPLETPKYLTIKYYYVINKVHVHALNSYIINIYLVIAIFHQSVSQRVSQWVS